MTTLAVIILCHDEVEHLLPCIKSALFADELVVFCDAGSPKLGDMTKLARAVGVRVEQRRFDNYASQRNAALERVAADWVLFVDVDERVTPELADEARAAIETDEAVGYGVPRHNYIFGKLTRYTGWYPDYQTRLLRRDSAHYDPDRPVHEVVVLDGPLGHLTEHLIHYNYRDQAQFVAKQRRYAAFDASILYAQGVRPAPRKYVTQPLRQFWWRFVTLQGYRDGLHGLRLSLLMAWYEWLKYRELAKLCSEEQSG
ncbi:MAG: glycosyltransferase family 2 protein [Anaerolineae bacterium]|nr:glycosyltransferase family 2 protein [Anaerolineae bacterium]